MPPAWLPALLVAALSLSACPGFEGNSSTVDPCGSKRESVSKVRVAAGDGGVAVVFNEGDLIMLGPAGEFRWALDPKVTWRYALLHVVGDVAFVVNGVNGLDGAPLLPYPVWVIGKGGVSKRTGPKNGCKARTIQPELDGVRLIGVVDQTDTLCSYRVRADATVDDEVVFDGPGTYGVAMRDGGYVLVAAGALIRYGAAGQTQWIRDLAATPHLVEADGGLYVVVAEATGWSVMWIGLDGTGERLVARFAFIAEVQTQYSPILAETSIGIGTMFATGRDAVLEVSHNFGANTLIRVSPISTVWANKMRSPMETLLGASESVLLLHGDRAVTGLDPTGAERFVQPDALAATLDSKGKPYVVGTVRIDECRRFGQVTALGPDGATLWTWHP